MDAPLRENQRKKSFWKSLNRTEKILLILFLGVVIIILIFVIITTKSKNAEWRGPKNVQECGDKHQRICLTPGCIKTAAQVLSFMDFSVDPCDDFYRFVCGNYMRTTTIPDDKTTVNTFNTITDDLQEQLRLAFEAPLNARETSSMQKVKKYYQACTNEKEIEKRGLKEVLDLLDRLGGWPVLKGASWDERKYNWLESTVSFRKEGIDNSFFLDFSVGFDLRNSTRRIIQLDQPTLGLSREFLLDQSKSNLSVGYYEFMVDTAILFGANKENAEAELAESLELEKSLAKFSLSKEARRNITRLYNPFTISELQQKYSTIAWLKYINSLLPKDLQIDENEVLLLGVPEYVNHLEDLLNKTSKRILANYAIWRAVKSLMPYLPDKIRQRELKYRKLTSGLTERPPRWKECVEEVSSSLPHLVGSLYIKKYFHEDAKKNAVDMTKYIRKEFENILENVDWMDQTTRKSALEKAAAITEHIAYPDELLDDKKLEKMFYKLQISEKHFLQSSLHIGQFMADFYYSRLHQAVNKTDWIDHGQPAQVNAFYHAMENSIVFPAGILQGLLFDKDRPHYMNYGAIGSVIGHEITHGFDDTGRQFDKNGNLIDWWAEDTKKSFLKKAQCIIEQYGNYSVAAINETLNGVNTQGENIADNGGVKEAYLAYNTWEKTHGPEPLLPGLDFTPYQLFWISAAMNWCSVQRPASLKMQVTTDQHSPGEFRVLGPFSNLEYFAQDFNCPANSRMNPVHKCLVW